MDDSKVMINRAPVLTLWGAVVAERLGHDADAALTLGKCLAGLNAQAKGRAIGLFGEPKKDYNVSGTPKKIGLGEEFWVTVCGRPLPAKNTEAGVRAVIKDRPIDADKVRKYLESKFGEELPAVREAMTHLAEAFDEDELDDVAYVLYEEFRPQIEKGRRGWGQKGVLDLDKIRGLVERA